MCRTDPYRDLVSERAKEIAASIPESEWKRAYWLHDRLAEIQQLKQILKELAEYSPYPDFEDTDGSCYFCGEKTEHTKTCVWNRAREAGL